MAVGRSAIDNLLVVRTRAGFTHADHDRLQQEVDEPATDIGRPPFFVYVAGPHTETPPAGARR